MRSSFSDSLRDVALATNFVWYGTFSLGAEVSQDPLDQFSQSLHYMVGTECVNALDFHGNALV